jgi:hypothetical protein
MQRAQWQRALDDLTEITNRLSTTDTFERKRAEIDRLAETCRENLKK